MVHALYLITDQRPRLAERCEAALAAGCRWLQYRNKSESEAVRRSQAQELQQLCERHGAHLIINDDVDLAARLGAGVHLGRTDMAVATARTQLGADAIIGATCHASLDWARQAQADGASYVAFGRFFPSQTKPHAPPATTALLQRAKEECCVPVVAIGGINLDNAALLVRAGADAVAVCHDVFSLDDPTLIAQRVEAYNALFSEPTY